MKKSMSDARKTIEAVIDRLLDDMEIATRDKMIPRENDDRKQFSG